VPDVPVRHLDPYAKDNRTSDPRDLVQLAQLGEKGTNGLVVLPPGLQPPLPLVLPLQQATRFLSRRASIEPNGTREAYQVVRAHLVDAT
jgi:hypothetical protein